MIQRIEITRNAPKKFDGYLQERSLINTGATP